MQSTIWERVCWSNLITELRGTQIDGMAYVPNLTHYLFFIRAQIIHYYPWFFCVAIAELNTCKTICLEILYYIALHKNCLQLPALFTYLYFHEKADIWWFTPQVPVISWVAPC